MKLYKQNQYVEKKGISKYRVIVLSKLSPHRELNIKVKDLRILKGNLFLTRHHDFILE
jgi:hypothetical protein